ncbi:hypothetical protein [Streptomyces lichenis]|uniref:Uncharacterized protein n=1 Tax=Streptomyces lichenis TaxID=2306967 RepID=A0ABT0IFY6_9ACTN|nr:hypothetical protein [Streptomyces lichenis]MCK8680240.1 hypothetical protein [Streptomyces lichenis]
MNAVGGQDGSSVPDEEWERFLRESAQGAAGAPKEPSARARGVAGRLRDTSRARGVAGRLRDTSRARGVAGRLRDTREAPPVWRAHTPPRPRRRTARAVAGLLAVCALLLLALFPDRLLGWFDGDGATSGGAPLAAETARPDQAPAVEEARRPTLDEPFKGSPAARWASGTEGITVPAAKATGWMDQAEVARALSRTRDFLAAANLDPAVLRGERPQTAITLINPHQSDVRKTLAAAFPAPGGKPPGAEDDPLLLFSRFDTRAVRLVGDDIRTRGRLSYEKGKDGALEVTADVTFVYPVTRAAADGEEEVVRTIVRRELVLSWDDPERVETEPGTFSLLSYAVDITNGGCGRDTDTGLLRPEFAAERSASADDGTPAVDPYDRSRPVDKSAGVSADGECGTVTRS